MLPPKSLSQCALGFCLALLVAAALVGCKENSAPPPTVTIDALPAALEKTFEKADPAIKKQISEIVSAIKAPDYASAYRDLQALLSHSGLNKKQGQLIASGLNTLNGLLQEAQSKGDETATQMLQTYRREK